MSGKPFIHGSLGLRDRGSRKHWWVAVINFVIIMIIIIMPKEIMTHDKNISENYC